MIVQAPTKPSPDREQQKELQKQQRKLSNLESALNKAKEDKQKLEEALGNPANYTDHQKFLALETEYKKMTAHFESLNKEYEVLFEKLLDMEG